MKKKKNMNNFTETKQNPKKNKNKIRRFTP